MFFSKSLKVGMKKVCELIRVGMTLQFGRHAHVIFWSKLPPRGFLVIFRNSWISMAVGATGWNGRALSLSLQTIVFADQIQNKFQTVSELEALKFQFCDDSIAIILPSSYHQSKIIRVSIIGLLKCLIYHNIVFHWMLCLQQSCSISFASVFRHWKSKNCSLLWLLSNAASRLGLIGKG